ncbi:MAG TPA: YcxB family protein [Opitutales bacterium]|jgi:hypothetical protein|nr:YcxB family protein [Opitutales bacterium]
MEIKTDVMGNEINLQYVYTEKVHREMWDASNAQRLARVIAKIIFCLAVLYVILLSLLWLTGKKIDWTSELLFLAIYGVVLAFVLLRLNSLPKRAFKKTPAANTVGKWKINESSLEFETPGYRINFEWRAFISGKETAAGFVLYVQPGLGYWISKPAFHSTEELELFRSWIQKHNIKLN